MKILLTIHADRNPDAGGAGVSAGLGEELGRLGHEVAYLSFSDLPAWLPYRAKGLAFPAFVARRLRRSKVDVIDAAVGDAWLLGMLRRRSTGPLLVARSHGLVQMADRARREEARRGGLELSWRYPLYWGGLRLWEVSRSLRAADLCLLLNDEEREFAIDELRLPEERVRVVDNGIPEGLLGRSLEDAGPAGAPFRIAHVGSYLPLKGARYVAAALGSVLERHPRAQASFLGTDCPAERVLADFRPELRPRVAVTPSYRRESLPELLRGHSVILSGTLKEGFPLGTLEAMACGLAPVTAATPGPLQYVRDGENGVVVPRADGAALAGAVERLIADPELLRRLREAALATAQRYGWDRVARDVLGLYEEALERRRSSPRNR
jgi:glycosyltransferase involved in cell wall biosynthesis